MFLISIWFILFYLGFVCEFWGKGKTKDGKGRERRGGKPFPCLEVKKPTKKEKRELMW